MRNVAMAWRSVAWEPTGHAAMKTAIGSTKSWTLARSKANVDAGSSS